MASHSPFLITLIVIQFVAFLANLLFLLMSRADVEDIIGFDLFPFSFSDVEGEVEIRPLPAVFSIWGVIYIWQIVWMFYGMSCICRQAPEGPVYTSPVLLTPTFYIISIFTWGFSMTWLYAATYAYRWWAFVMLFGLLSSTCICIGLTHKAVAEHYDSLVKQDRMKDVWLIRFMVQNGMAVYASWCTVATQLQLAAALAYDPYPQFDQEVASTIALGILCGELLLFVIMDWFVLERHTRYTFTPYLVLTVALGGSLARNWNPVKRNSIITVVLLSFVGLAAIVKFVLLFVRHFRDAKKDSNILPTLDEKSSGTRL